MSETPPERRRGPDPSPESSFGAAPGSSPWPQGGFNPQPYGDRYPQQGGSPQQPYAGPAAVAVGFPRNTAVLLVLSILGVVLTGIIGLPSAVIAALAWRRHRTDPPAAARRTTIGWVVLGVNVAIGTLVLIPFYIWASNNR